LNSKYFNTETDESTLKVLKSEGKEN